MEDEVNVLQAKVAGLEEQLRFARQKASLYYITASELDALKRGKEDFVERISVGVSTASNENDSTAHACAETQTEFPSLSLLHQVELDSAKADNVLLRCMNESLSRSEGVRAKMLVSVRGLCESIQDNDSQSRKNHIDFILTEYTSLLEEFVQQTRMSVKHTIELKRRDEMISSLFEKIRMLEDAFSKKLSESSQLADSRQEVIRELGDQVRDAINIARNVEPQETFDWSDMAAMHSEMEDLRAELSKARTNWAATRDELIRLQFRVGVDGRGNHSPEKPREYPPPIMALVDVAAREQGMISGLRSIRFPSPQ